jgi:hypothetical protein
MTFFDRLLYSLAAAYMGIALLNDALEDYLSSAGVLLVIWRGLSAICFFVLAVRAWRIK